jgi:PHD/YefM family antitoxin component YafN of YafNO toxin-antitoxin module
MKIKEDIRSVTYLKNKAADLLTQINTTRRAVVITQNGEARGILQDPESYKQMRRAIAMLQLVAQGESDMQAGRTVAADVVFTRLRKTLSARPPDLVGFSLKRSPARCRFPAGGKSGVKPPHSITEIWRFAICLE